MENNSRLSDVFQKCEIFCELFPGIFVDINSFLCSVESLLENWFFIPKDRARNEIQRILPEIQAVSSLETILEKLLKLKREILEDITCPEDISDAEEKLGEFKDDIKTILSRIIYDLEELLNNEIEQKYIGIIFLTFKEIRNRC